MVKVLEVLSRRLDEAGPGLERLDQYYSGTQPLSFLAPEAREALRGRLSALAVGYPRLAVDALAERLRVIGFLVDGAADPDLWNQFERSGMGDEGQGQAHTEALVAGRSFVTVWADEVGPTLSVESARDFAVDRHPVTGQVLAAVKRWVADNVGHAVLWLPDAVSLWHSSAAVPERGMVPAEGWVHERSTPNPLGRVPVATHRNGGRLRDVDGTSEMAPLLDLADGINKLMADMLISSEFYARPRRWATGLEIEEDEEGNAVNPFADGPERVWQSESPETKFGQFDAARLDGYESAVKVLTQQVMAVSGLPAHLLGIHGDQPPSGDAIRSAESSLVAKAIARQRSFGRSWAEVGALMLAVSGRAVGKVEAVWASPETRTPAQAADAAAKLVGQNIIPREQALLDLGYSPEQVDQMRAMRSREAMDQALTAPAPAPRAAEQ